MSDNTEMQDVCDGEDQSLIPNPATPADIPEDSEIEFDFSTFNQENRSPLPPHIAARFYRPSNSRRKSSAASSRRNSITSSHSRQSHASERSLHGGPQSNHVAQHLRRISILETRKQRLADRAAHAEKVRLRAALNKAAPRCTNNSEERALAAQQAREKNLAEIVANCAAEVERAKAVAESMKEKREAEGKKMRKDMEEKLAEAERRREEILSRAQNKRGRTLSMANTSPSRPSKSLLPMVDISKPISEETAAIRIQSQWRAYTRFKALQEFASFDLTIEKVRNTSFEEVSACLAQEKVLLSTAKILNICGLKEGEKGSVNEMTAVRTFLASFFILGHPTQILSTKDANGELEQVGIAPGVPMRRDDLANPQLQELVAKAGSLLVCFENVLSRLTAFNNYTPPPAQLAPLSEAYAAFYNSFIAWKARDSNALLDMMVLQFVELDAIWMTVKDSTEEAVTASYRDGIRENQLKLMVRIKRLAGPVEGKRLIAKAIRESRKARATKPAGDVRPRAAAEASPAPTSPPHSAPKVAEAVVDKHLQTLTPPPTPTRSIPSALQSSQADGLRNFRTLIPNNRIVVHELAMDRQYRIDMDDCLDAREEFRAQLFGAMREEIANGNMNPWILAMAENIRFKLQKLLKEGGSYYKLIGGVLDVEVISQELRSGAFSVEKFFSFMANIVPKLCAPMRDEEAKDLVENKLQNGDFVTRLEALMQFIDVMQLDYANYILTEAAPQLLEHAVSYEMKAFADSLQTEHSLERTVQWWNNSKAKVEAEIARRDPEGINLARSRPTTEMFYNQMIVDIVTSYDLSAPALPETLLLDERRIRRLNGDIIDIVCTGSVLLQAKNLMKRDVRSQWRTEATRILSVLGNTTDAEQAKEGIQTALESCRNMPTATKSNLRSFISGVAQNAVAAKTGKADITQPVMRILLGRLKTHILARISASTSNEKVRAASTAGESLASLGLPEFVSQINKIVDEMSRMAKVDKDTHGKWYELIETGAEGLSA